MIDFNNLFDGMHIGVFVGVVLNALVLWGCLCGWRNKRRRQDKDKDGGR